jgi:hypothetical protein
LGLAGKWGPIVREWLDVLLPADAHLRCQGRVFVLVTALGGGGTSPTSPRGSFGSSNVSSSTAASSISTIARSSSRSTRSTRSTRSSSSSGSGSDRGGTWSLAWPPLRRVRVTDFVDRADLIDALMASVSLSL